MYILMRFLLFFMIYAIYAEAKSYVEPFNAGMGGVSNDVTSSRRYGPQQRSMALQQAYVPAQSSGYQQQRQQPYNSRQSYGSNAVGQRQTGQDNQLTASGYGRDDGQYGPEYRNQTRYMFNRNKSNKCTIWIPEEALDKYPMATILQTENSKRLKNIQICCPGYGLMYDNQCRPLCDNCRNGMCVAPNVCQCFEEFVRNDNGDCVFTCPLGCLNGRCFLDGSCQCDPGYKLDETRRFCRPICSRGCGTNPLLNCTEPEVCGCIKGYTLIDDGCKPVCEPDCGIGGICKEPDCGFDRQRDPNSRTTLCDKPNVCECLNGYTLKEGVCQADCYQKCDNGICYSRNRCICNPGYVYHERSTLCIPK